MQMTSKGQMIIRYNNPNLYQVGEEPRKTDCRQEEKHQ